MMRASKEEIDNIFTFHPGKPDQLGLYEELRAKARELAQLYREKLPDSREASLAITNLQQASMMAIASIAIHS